MYNFRVQNVLTSLMMFGFSTSIIMAEAPNIIARLTYGHSQTKGNNSQQHNYIHVISSLLANI